MRKYFLYSLCLIPVVATISATAVSCAKTISYTNDATLSNISSNLNGNINRWNVNVNNLKNIFTTNSNQLLINKNKNSNNSFNQDFAKNLTQAITQYVIKNPNIFNSVIFKQWTAQNIIKNFQVMFVFPILNYDQITSTYKLNLGCISTYNIPNFIQYNKKINNIVLNKNQSIVFNLLTGFEQPSNPQKVFCNWWNSFVKFGESLFPNDQENNISKINNLLSKNIYYDNSSSWSQLNRLTLMDPLNKIMNPNNYQKLSQYVDNLLTENNSNKSYKVWLSNLAPNLLFNNENNFNLLITNQQTTTVTLNNVKINFYPFFQSSLKFKIDTNKLNNGDIEDINSTFQGSLMYFFQYVF